VAPETLVAFTAASLILAFAPGPDNLFVLMQSALHGWRMGLAVTLGLCSGLVVHTAAVAFGVAVLFKQSDLAFLGLKAVGASYLLYLAWGAFRAGPAALPSQVAGARPFGRLYLRGIVMNVTNPKVAIFFLAFLPQFTDPARGNLATQIAVLGFLFMASALVAFSLIAVLAGSISQRLLGSTRAQVFLNRFAGLVFVALAVRLALSER
jgi:threonine/homoserine/homoserine lactone efflux protein